MVNYSQYPKLKKIDGLTGTYHIYVENDLSEFIKGLIELQIGEPEIKFNIEKYGFKDKEDFILFAVLKSKKTSLLKKWIKKEKISILRLNTFFNKHEEEKNNALIEELKQFHEFIRKSGFEKSLEETLIDNIDEEYFKTLVFEYLEEDEIKKQKENEKLSKKKAEEVSKKTDSLEEWEFGKKISLKDCKSRYNRYLT